MYVDPAPTLEQLVDRLDPREIIDAVNSPVADGERSRYLHWDKLRRLPAPTGLRSELWWLKGKWARREVARPLPLVDKDGKPFNYTLPDLVHRSLHHIDQRGGGEVAMDEVVTSEREAGHRFLVHSLMEGG